MLMVEDGWCLHVSAWHLKGKDLWALWVATWCQVWMRVTLQKSHSSSTGQSCHVCLEQIWSIYHLQSLINEHDVSILIRFCLPEYALPQCPHFGSWGKFWCRASLRSKRALSFPGSRLLQEVLRRQRHLRHWVLALAIALMALMALMALVACIRQLNHFAFVGTCWHDWVILLRLNFDFPSFVSWGQQRSASTSASSQLEAQILWTGAKLDQTDPPGEGQNRQNELFGDV